MRRLKQAQRILEQFGLPPRQCNEISGLTFLSLANIRRNDPWSKAESTRLRIHDILQFVQAHYDRRYAENTRETIRRQVIHQFEQAGIIERNPDDRTLPTNSPRTHYALTASVLGIIRTYWTKSWSPALKRFLTRRSTLLEIYQKKRRLQMIPVKVAADKQLKLSPGKHNRLQVAIVEQFAPRFAPGAHLLYLGDTARKMLYLDRDRLTALGIPANEHDKLPDVVLFHSESNRLFLVEAVTSHGPVSPKRHFELEQVLSHIKVTRVYVSAFPDFKEFKNHIGHIAWETEVWIGDIPDHLIHFNGERFLP
ncbi:MAG: BsuBI/PstI family type II restriction endonuclease [Planctomycetota bacterium]